MYKDTEMLQSIEEVGFEKGKILALEKITKNLLLSGLLTNKQIAEVTGLSLKRINELAKALKNQQ